MPQYRRYKSNAERQAAYRNRQAMERRRELADKGLPPLPRISTMPGTARWNAAVERCVALLDMVREEMTEYYSERSETWQLQNYRAEEHKENIKTVQRLLTKLEELSFVIT
jgi:hypothetical protein